MKEYKLNGHNPSIAKQLKNLTLWCENKNTFPVILNQKNVQGFGGASVSEFPLRVGMRARVIQTKITQYYNGFYLFLVMVIHLLRTLRKA